MKHVPVSKVASQQRRHRRLHRRKLGHLERAEILEVGLIDAAVVAAAAVQHGHVHAIGVVDLLVALRQLPQLDLLVVGGQHKVGRILARIQPTNRVDLLLDLQTLEIVKLRLVTLEGRVQIILVGFARVLDVKDETC